MLSETLLLNDEYQKSCDSVQKTLDLFDQVSEEMKLRYINVIQKTYNLAGNAFSWQDQKDNREMATRYLLKAEEIYELIHESTTMA